MRFELAGSSSIHNTENSLSSLPQRGLSPLPSPRLVVPVGDVIPASEWVGGIRNGGTRTIRPTPGSVLPDVHSHALCLLSSHCISLASTEQFLLPTVPLPDVLWSKLSRGRSRNGVALWPMPGHMLGQWPPQVTGGRARSAFPSGFT